MRAWSLAVQRNAYIGVAAIQVPDSTGAVVQCGFNVTCTRVSMQVCKLVCQCESGHCQQAHRAYRHTYVHQVASAYARSPLGLLHRTRRTRPAVKKSCTLVPHRRIAAGMSTKQGCLQLQVLGIHENVSARTRSARALTVHTRACGHALIHAHMAESALKTAWLQECMQSATSRTREFERSCDT
jgi:hypothetical protein